MSKAPLRKSLWDELETPRAQRRFGAGWISGVLSFLLAMAVLLLVICNAFPDFFVTPQLQPLFASVYFPAVMIGVMIAVFMLALISVILRPNKLLGLVAIGLILAASLIGTFVQGGHSQSGMFFGLDFFVLNVALTGLLFVPLERLFPRYREQRLFRLEWREDLFYYFVSSMLVQILSYLAMLPANFLNQHVTIAATRQWIGAQPLLLQVLEIMVLTDFVQYFVHRLFHKIPMLWRFHAVHHSAKSMDWLAGARMHFFEIVILRGVTAIPMLTFGYTALAVQIYLLIVYLYSSFIHANIGWNLEWLGKYVVTPRFHHWHHGIEREAIDVNFAIHFPIFDRLFKTYFLPEGRWPKGYGISKHPVPHGYWKQFLYPFKR